MADVKHKTDWLPILCYFALLVAYLALCNIEPDARPVVGGFAIGILSQMCLDWRRNRAIGAARATEGSAT